MEEYFDIDVLRVVRTADGVMPANDVVEIVVGVVIGSELTDGREPLIAAGIAAHAIVFIDDLLEGIGVVHVATAGVTAIPSERLDRAVASAVVAWFAVLETPARSIAIDGRVILPADPQDWVDGVGMVTVSFPVVAAHEPARLEQPGSISLADAGPL